MEAARRTFLVTGANRGIGYQIVKKLYRDLLDQPVEILMTSRQLDLGLASIGQIKAEVGGTEAARATLSVLPLDVNSEESRAQLVQELSSRNRQIDTLINNAGVAYYTNSLNEVIINNTMRTNYYSPRYLTEALLQHGLIAPHGKVIFVSSSLGTFSNLRMAERNPELLARLKDYRDPAKFSLIVLDELVQQYEAEVRTKPGLKKWGSSVYSASKLFLSLYCKELGRSPQILRDDIEVYSLCPGWCQTDMTKGRNAPLTAAEGAETPCFLATLPSGIKPEWQGEFFYFKQRTDLDQYVAPE